MIFSSAQLNLNTGLIQIYVPTLNSYKNVVILFKLIFDKNFLILVLEKQKIKHKYGQIRVFQIYHTYIQIHTHV